jgi:hypothetical protein
MSLMIPLSELVVGGNLGSSPCHAKLRHHGKYSQKSPNSRLFASGNNDRAELLTSTSTLDDCLDNQQSLGEWQKVGATDIYMKPLLIAFPS